MAAADARSWSARASLLFSGLVLAACGCGLGDYEKHMDEEQAFLKEFDDENKALGAPLEMPMKSAKVGKTAMPNDDALPVKFFLRPPRWTAPKTNEGEDKTALYRYPGPPGFNVLFADANLDTNPLTKATIKGGLAPKEFHSQVRGALVQFVLREHKLAVNGWLAADNLSKESLLVKHQGRQKNLEFDKQVFTEATPGAKEDPKHHVFEVYYRIDGLSQAAVIYEIPLGFARDQETRRIIEFSLKSLTLGPDALSKLQLYVLRRRPQSSTPGKVINANDLK
jgi:hypothetical protein